MESGRMCGWMSGPRDPEIKVPAAKWWLAVSRDELSKNYRRQMCKERPPVTCNLTPKFVSPLPSRHR